MKNKILAVCLLLVSSLIVIDSKACDVSGEPVIITIDNGDGTFTYDISFCVEIGNLDVEYLGSIFEFFPAERNVLSAHMNTTTSITLGGETLVLETGDNIGTCMPSFIASYKRNHLNTYNGKNNVAAYTYCPGGIYHVFPISGTECFQIEITLDGCASDVTFDAHWAHKASTNSSSCIHDIVLDPSCVNVEPSCQVSDTSISACNNGDNTATFDLTNLVFRTGGNDSDNPIRIEGADQSTYDNLVLDFSSQSSYVYTVTADGCDNDGTLALTMDGPLLERTESSTSDCDPQATIDLTHFESDFFTDPGYTASWEYDADGSGTRATVTIETAAPVLRDPQVYYVTVSDGSGCDVEGTFTYNATGLIASDIPDIKVCNAASVDLTAYDGGISAGYTVQWQTSNIHGDGVINDSDAQNWSTNGLVYAFIQDGACTDFVEVNVTLTNVSATDISDILECTNSTVDLTSNDNTIGGGLTVQWQTSSIYNQGVISNGEAQAWSTSGTVYAFAVDGDCYDNVEVEVTIVSYTLNDVNDSYCIDQGGTYSVDLNDYENSISNIGTFTWSDDNGVVTSPFEATQDTTLTATVDYNGCSKDASFNITLNNNPVGIGGVYRLCSEDDGTGIFNLTNQASIINMLSSTATVKYYLDEDLTNGVPTDEYDAYSSTNAIIYALLESPEGCFDTVELELQPESVTAEDQSMLACDEGSGTATFDLTSINDAVTGGGTFNITWVDNDDGSDTPLGFPNNHESGGNESVYAIVSHPTIPNCFEYAEVELEVSDIEAADASISICNDNLSQLLVDLTEADSVVNGGTGNPVTYYTDPSLNSNFAIANPDEYVVPSVAGVTVYGQVIFGSCSSSSEVTVTVYDAPNLIDGREITCDLGDGTGEFNLDNQAIIVKGLIDPTATIDQEWWSLDVNGLFPIDTSQNDMTAYISSTVTIYYHVIINGCASAATVDLTVEPLDIDKVDKRTCPDADGNGYFDLNDLEEDVTKGNRYTVAWYEDPTTTDLCSNYHPLDNYVSNQAVKIIYAEVSQGNCTEVIPIELLLEDIYINEDTIYGCGLNGSGTLNLNVIAPYISGTNDITFYRSLPRIDLYEITGDELDEFLASDGSEIYVTVSDGSCDKDGTIPIKIFESPEANPIRLPGCDYSQNGFAVYDLTSGNDQISDPSYQFGYYSAQHPDSIIYPPLDQYVSAGGEVYVLVYDGLCMNMTTIALDVYEAPLANVIDIEGCDGDLDNSASFDLEGNIGRITNNAGLDLTWSLNGQELSPDLSDYESGNATLELTVLDPATTCSTVTTTNLVLNQDVPSIYYRGNCTNNITSFLYSASANFTGATWDFGDGSTGSGVNVSHEYQTTDALTVTLSGTSGNCTFTATEEIEIKSFELEVIDDQNIFEGESVILTTNHSDDGSVLHKWTGVALDDANSSSPEASPVLIEDQDEFTYYVVVTNEDSCTASGSVIITVDGDRTIETPTSFTPDGDGINDNYIFPANGVCTINFSIFNRWGKLMFNTNDPNQGWDGTYEGKEQPMDNYAYHAEVEYCNGEKVFLKGYIVLIR